MVVIKEENKFKERREEIRRIRSILNLDMPKGYRVYNNEVGIFISKHQGMWGWEDIAELNLEEGEMDNLIRVTFNEDCEDELEKLRSCFNKSETKFILEIHSLYY